MPEVRRVDTQIEPEQVHPDAYPVTRVSTEFHLRAIDSLTRVQEDVVDALIVLTLVRNQMVARREALRIRALARLLDAPYETVRRRVEGLVERRQCVAAADGVAVPPDVLRSRQVRTFLRETYVNTVRLLADLTRIKVAAFASTARRPIQSERLTKDQRAIALAGTSLLLAGLRALRGFWGGDLMKGMVYTAIWTANVKHVTNTDPVANGYVLPDSQRLPVSVLAISRSLRLPYETVRRHADALVREGICVRADRRGLVVPASFIVRIASGPIIAHRLVLDFLVELRRAGVKA